MGYKQFTPDILQSTDVNEYLMNQAVMVFDSAAARDSSLTAPTEGMVVYLKDTNQMLVYTGSTWVLPNQTTTNPTGLEFVTSGTTTTATTASVNSCFSSAYSNYRVTIWDLRPSVTQDIRLRVRAGTTDLINANYYAANIFAGGTISSNSELAQTSFRGVYTADTGGNYNAFQFDIYRPQETRATVIIAHGTGWDGSTIVNRSYTGFVDTSASYDGFSMFVASPNTVRYNYAVYGYKK